MIDQEVLQSIEQPNFILNKVYSTSINRLLNFHHLSFVSSIWMICSIHPNCHGVGSSSSDANWTRSARP